MDKEEVLKKSRAEGEDEGELHANLVGAKWGFIGMIAIYITLFLGTLLLFDGESYKYAASMHAIVWFGTGMKDLGYGIDSRRKSMIILGVVKAVLGFVWGWLYFLVLVQ